MHQLWVWVCVWPVWVQEEGKPSAAMFTSWGQQERGDGSCRDKGVRKQRNRARHQREVSLGRYGSCNQFTCH